MQYTGYYQEKLLLSVFVAGLNTNMDVHLGQ